MNKPINYYIEKDEWLIKGLKLIKNKQNILSLFC